MVVVGLDGFRGGWVAVLMDGAARELHFLGTLEELSSLRFDRAAIDMPIGLPDSGSRHCDIEARRLLGAHRSRVFTGARRSLLGFSFQAEANTVLKQRREAGVSVQLWNLVPKIREVDDFISRHPKADLREAHPELVFLRLNGNVPLPSKKEPEGIDLRCAILGRAGFDQLKTWLTQTKRGTGAKADDVLDACAVAIAARDFDQGHVVPQGDPPSDTKGLPMRIWY